LPSIWNNSADINGSHGKACANRSFNIRLVENGGPERTNSSGQAKELTESGAVCGP